MGHLFDKRIPTRKAFLRLWAFFLSAVTLFSLLPVGLPTEAAEEETLRITADGIESYDVHMTTRDRVELSALDAPEGAAYQWQILHPESDSAWVSIYDGIKQQLSVTMALAKNMLRPDGTVLLRCRATGGGKVLYSDPVTVHITEPQPIQTVAAPQETKSLPTISGAEGDPVPEFVTVTIEYVRYDYQRDDTGKLVVDSEGNPVLDTQGSQAFLPYVATLQGGATINTVVPNPTMVGYDAWYKGEKATSVTLQDTDGVTENVTYTVEYKPALVNYAIRYFMQNVYDDLYVEDTDAYKESQGYTGTTPPESLLNKEFPGFTSLYYQPDFIAADGSTVFEVYYERNYYLMEFDCAGGYGTETLYIRYGSYISVPQPIKAGWVFGGWDQTYYSEIIENAQGEEEELKHNVANGSADTLPETMPAFNSGYKAIWNTTATTYTVVYWRENADDNGYSYWGSAQKNANSNTYVSGADDVPTSVTNAIVDGQTLNEKPYFTYNDALTDKNVLVEGDGSTIVNVYYTRNKYTIRFEIDDNDFTAPATHIHQEGVCYGVLDCDLGHTHDASCNPQLVCTITEHTHSADCCTKENHTHTDDCCKLTQHTHNYDECCSLELVTAYQTSCFGSTDDWYSEIGNQQNSAPQGAPASPAQGQVYRPDWSWYQYIYIGNSWYEYRGYTQSGNIASTVCSHHHTHNGTACNTENCSVGYEHTHGTNCEYGKGDCPNYEHSHGDGNCTCSLTAHTHTESCYTFSCGAPSHTHTDDCYTVCNKPETQIVTINNTKYYQITAKYDQTIGDVWPTAANFPKITFRGWSVDGISGTTQVSKRINMTKDLCDTADGEKKATMVTGGSKNYLYYMFESFDQSSPANGNARILRNGVYYDKSDLYYQEVNSSGNWNQKEIAGMSPVSNGVVESGSNVFLYYTRNRHTLKFHNYNAELTDYQKTLMYEAPLEDYEIPEAEVPYPSTLEPKAYEFGGWYTTPQCFDGTEVKWDTIKMPNSDLTLYAKWTPILRNVTFYNTYDDMVNKATPFLEAKNVPHGELLGSTYNKQPDEREGYRFIGWFYMDDENKKRFAPDSMEITRDLELFAEWTTQIDTTYEVTYVLAEDIPETDYKKGMEIADPEFNHITVGKTKTFQAKGGTQLDLAFRTSYFPKTNSHSILMKEDEDENTYAFEYVYDPEVYYKVEYLDYQTRTELAPSKTDKTSNAIITEKFIPIEGRRPTAFYITKALASDGNGDGSVIPPENILTFYYIQDTEHGMYSIEHYLENENSDDPTDPNNYTMYGSKVGPADVGLTITGVPNTYTGFTHQPSMNLTIWYVITDNGDDPDTITEKQGNVLSGPVTYAGLTIKIYYSRNSYPYIIEYREYGAAEDAEPLLTTTGSAKYDTSVSHTAPMDLTVEIEDPDTHEKKEYSYTYYDSEADTDEERTKPMDIRVVEGDGENPNKLIFYYVQKKIPVHYHAVCTEETSVQFGAVSIASESAATPAGLGGSTAIPASGFVFKGWFHDEECTQPADASWVNTADHNRLKPKEFTLEEGEEEDHYYALFEPVKRDLKIVKSGTDILETESFLFTVSGTNAIGQEINLTISIQGTGEVLIKDLYCGTYTVTELTGWSWAYTCADSDQEVTLTVENADVQTLTFTNTRQEPDWLTGETVTENQFD